MEITGKIVAVLPERSGTSQRSGSEWRCASYVIETGGEFSRRMVFEVFGSDRIAQFNIQMGELLSVSFDIDAREYNGRWFNTIRAFRVDRGTMGAQPQAQPAAAPFGQPAAPFGQPAAAPAAAPFAQPAAQPAAPFAAQTPQAEGEELPF